MKPVTKSTCDSYLRQIGLGGDPSEIVSGLACFYQVNRPAIWKRLRMGGALPPYRTKVDIKRGRRPRAELNADRASQPRVDRDPCQRCGVRHDIGCKHDRAPVGMTF
jgi:hypothetical protein